MEYRKIKNIENDLISKQVQLLYIQCKFKYINYFAKHLALIKPKLFG